MDLKVDYQNSKDKNEAYQKVKAAITPDVIAKFNVKADFDYKENEKIAASGKGFDLAFNFTDTGVEVDLKLGLLFKAFKGKVLEGVEKQLKRVV